MELERAARRTIGPGAEFGSRVDIEDIVQDGLLQIWRHRTEAAAIESRMAWIRRIGQGHTLKSIRFHTQKKRDIRRDQFVNGELRSDERGSETDCQARELLSVLQSAIDELDPLPRYIVRKHGIDGISIREVARDIGRNPSACRRMFHRALSELRKAMIAAIGRLTGETDQVAC